MLVFTIDTYQHPKQKTTHTKHMEASHITYAKTQQQLTQGSPHLDPPFHIPQEDETLIKSCMTPSSSCTSYNAVFQAFRSAQSCVFPTTLKETNCLINSENCEFVHALKKAVAPGETLQPRCVGISLVLPTRSNLHFSSGVPFNRWVDAFATLSVTEVSEADCKPLTTFARFTIYGGICTHSIHQLLEQESFEPFSYVPTITDDASMIVLRWLEAAANGNPCRFRTEGIRLENDVVYANATEILQKKLLEMAFRHSVYFPCLGTSRVRAATQGAFARQIMLIANDFYLLSHRESLVELLNDKRGRYTCVAAPRARMEFQNADDSQMREMTSFNGIFICNSTDFLPTVGELEENVNVDTNANISPLISSLHIGYKHANILMLKGSVSLYGVTNSPGLPLVQIKGMPLQHKNEACIYSVQMAIRPVDILQETFRIYPCKLSSLQMQTMEDTVAFTNEFIKHGEIPNKTIHEEHGEIPNKTIHEEHLPVVEPTRSSHDIHSLGICEWNRPYTLSAALAELSRHQETGLPTPMCDLLSFGASIAGCEASVMDGLRACAETIRSSEKRFQDKISEIQSMKDMHSHALQLLVTGDTELLPCAHTSKKTKMECIVYDFAIAKQIIKKTYRRTSQAGSPATHIVLDTEKNGNAFTDVQIKSIATKVYESYMLQPKKEFEKEHSVILDEIMNTTIGYTTITPIVATCIRICLRSFKVTSKCFLLMTFKDKVNKTVCSIHKLTRNTWVLQPCNLDELNGSMEEACVATIRLHFRSQSHIVIQSLIPSHPIHT